MIEFTKGDILESDAEALVNTVNCVGIMGRGIALQFKEKFPANFKAYAAALEPLSADDVALAVAYTLDQPQHVSVNEIVVRPAKQER